MFLIISGHFFQKNKSMSKKIAMTAQELKEGLRTAAAKIKDPKERRLMLRLLKKYHIFLDVVQQRPVPTRDAYHEAAGVVFRYLMTNSQLDRHVGPFDENVKIILNETIGTIKNEV